MFMYLILGCILIKCWNMLSWLWRTLFGDGREQDEQNVENSNFDSIVVNFQQECAEKGFRCNHWQPAVPLYGLSDHVWLKSLQKSQYVGDMEFDEREWARAQDVVDDVLSRLLDKMKSIASYSYKGLRIDEYVRQGSSRDGLKVIAPNEFDIGFEFSIDGISFSEIPIEHPDGRVPGFCYLTVDQSVEKLRRICPELVRERVFQMGENDRVYLSSKMLHRAVFQSLIDKSCMAVERDINKVQLKNRFSITRKMNPPAVNITVHLYNDVYGIFQKQGSLRDGESIITDIDIDIIPALRLTKDTVSEYDGERVNADIHAICKWKEDEAYKVLEIADQNLVWLINSVAYERHIFDAARTDVKQQYILTALRIAKTYCTKAEEIYKNKNLAPPPVTVLQSYHLKQITCYVILYTCYMYPDTVISGARQALEYLLAFLDICLGHKKLPHFFYSNTKIREMFNKYPYAYECDRRSLRYNMFRKIKTDALVQAKVSLKKHMALNLDVAILNARDSISLTVFSSDIPTGTFI